MFSTTSLVKYLNENPPVVAETETIRLRGWPMTSCVMGTSCAEIISWVDQWTHYIYNIYCEIHTAKELWNSLGRKYKTKDVGTKKFVVLEFLDFKKVDDKSVVEQVQQFQLILHDTFVEGMVLAEASQVAPVIEKLPPCWKEFKSFSNTNEKR